MSSSGITATNSGPLIIRTVLDQSADNTYLLGLYDYPVSSNRVLTTSTNGLLAPSDSIIISSIQVSSFLANNIQASSIETSSIQISSLLDRDGVVGSAGEVLHTDGNTAYWGPSGAGTGYWTEVGNDIFNNNSGNVTVNSTFFVSTISSSSLINLVTSSFLNISSFRINSVASTFWFGSQNPANIDAFKIELYGANLDIYRSSVSSIDATFVENNGGGQLVLATNNPTVFINGATNGNNFVGINQPYPQYTLDVAGSSYISTGLTLNGGGAGGGGVSFGSLKIKGGVDENAIFIVDGTLTNPGLSTNGYFIGNSNNFDGTSTFQIGRVDGGAQPSKAIYLAQSGNVFMGGTYFEPSTCLTIPVKQSTFSSPGYFNGFNNGIAVNSSDVNTIIGATATNGSNYGEIQVTRQNPATPEPWGLALNTYGGPVIIGSTSQNVGIGTFNPNYTLDVNGNGNINGSFYVGPSGQGQIRLTTAANNSYIESGSTNNSGAGNKLKFTNINYANPAVLTVDTVNSLVGINNESPAYALDVAGNTNISGNLSVSGTALSRVVCSTLLADPGSNGNNWTNYYGVYNYISSNLLSSVTLPNSNTPNNGTIIVLRNVGNSNSITVTNTADTTGNSILPGKTSSYTYVTGVTSITNGWYGL